MVDVPDASEAAKAQNNVYYWSDGKQMVATGGETTGRSSTIDQIPEAMQNAVISAENKTFYDGLGRRPDGHRAAPCSTWPRAARPRVARPSPSST